MTVDDVRTRLAEIEAMLDENEVAHRMEDDLWRDVLRHISEGGGNARELATAALKTTAIEFTRWYS